MSSLHRVTLSVALTFAPLMGTGCSTLCARQEVTRAVMRTEAKMNSARLEESRGNLTEAKRLYTEIHRQDPRNAVCSHRLAVVCMGLNQHSEAEVYYAQAFAVNPNDAELLADMGYAAYLRKDYQKSQSLLEQSVKLNGNDLRSIGNLAIVLAWQDNDEACLETFRRIHSETDAIRHLAAIQIARGDMVRGQKNYELARSLEAARKVNTTVVAQTSASKTEIIPVDLPAPSSSIPAALPSSVASQTTIMTQLLQAEEADQGARPSTVPVAEAPVDLPSPEPLLPIQSAEKKLEDQADLNKPASGIEAANLPPAQLPELSSSQDDNFVTPSSPVAESTTGVTVLPTPLPAEPMPSPEEQVPTTVSQPEQKSNPPTIWRQSKQSLGFQSSRKPVDSISPKVETPVAESAAVDDGTALNNVCLVTLIEERRITSALSQFESEHHSQKYRFSSAEAMEKFRQTPEKYAPVAGGLDIVSVRDERKVVQGSLNFAICYQRHLYLFSNSEHAEAFLREPHKYVTSD